MHLDVTFETWGVTSNRDLHRITIEYTDLVSKQFDHRANQKCFLENATWLAATRHVHSLLGSMTSWLYTKNEAVCGCCAAIIYEGSAFAFCGREEQEVVPRYSGWSVRRYQVASLLWCVMLLHFQISLLCSVQPLNTRTNYESKWCWRFENSPTKYFA